MRIVATDPFPLSALPDSGQRQILSQQVRHPASRSGNQLTDGSLESKWPARLEGPLNGMDVLRVDTHENPLPGDELHGMQIAGG